MLRLVAILAVSSWLALPAGAAAGEPPAEAPPTTAEWAPAKPQAAAASDELRLAEADHPPATPPAERNRSNPVKEVAIDPTAKPPVCRRYFPTGSRIATERCQSAEVDNAAHSAEREQTRRDIDEMRMRQMARDQARAAAQAEALRRRAAL